MQYRADAKGTPISLLGYGCMRFEKKGTQYDFQKAERDILHAIKKGVTYFDTAYIYGNSEAILGEVLQKHNLRDKVYIATKLPHYLIRSKKGLDNLFAQECKRLRTSYIDYYLMHMLTDIDTWKALIGMGILEWIAEKKASGQIRNIGFSYHGATAMFKQLVDVYNWDFCMIQYNYVDEHSQAGRAGLHYAHSKGLAVMIMEPLRGGNLVNALPAKAKQLMAKNERNYSPAEWAFRWLFSQPEVTCVLSGMFTTAMVDDNVRIASETAIGSFSEDDFALIDKVKECIAKAQKVPCTGCGYCLPCPAHVDIPGSFHSYNAMFSESKHKGRSDYLKATALRKTPSSASNCIHCLKCVKHCPQRIDIPTKLAESSKALETPQYKLLKWVVQRFHIWK